MATTKIARRRTERRKKPWSDFALKCASKTYAATRHDRLRSRFDRFRSGLMQTLSLAVEEGIFHAPRRCVREIGDEPGQKPFRVEFGTVYDVVRSSLYPAEDGLLVARKPRDPAPFVVGNLPAIPSWRHEGGQQIAIRARRCPLRSWGLRESSGFPGHAAGEQGAVAFDKTHLIWGSPCALHRVLQTGFR